MDPIELLFGLVAEINDTIIMNSSENSSWCSGARLVQGFVCTHRDSECGLSSLLHRFTEQFRGCPVHNDSRRSFQVGTLWGRYQVLPGDAVWDEKTCRGSRMSLSMLWRSELQRMEMFGTSVGLAGGSADEARSPGKLLMWR